MIDPGPPEIDRSVPAGLYVHVPFCSAKCPYCDFLSLASTRLIPAWQNALEAEAALYRDVFGPFQTLYIGGGTPSRLSDRRLGRLIEGLRSTFDFSPGAEVTLEANPEDVDRERAGHWLELGVNRISLGIQSLNDAELVFLGRRHSAERAKAAASDIRAAGCANLSLDLMYGLPGQDAPIWLKTLNKALALEPDHLSCYSLTIEGRTRFAQLRDRGELNLPDEEAGRRLFLATSRHLTDRGWRHYEISNFARSDEFLSRHNSAYWLHRPYLGLGPGAHSFGGGWRWWNQTSLRMYSRLTGRGGRPLAGTERLSLDQLNLERLFLGLRTDSGVPLELVELMSGGRDKVDAAVDRGLVTVRLGAVIATRRGLAVADALALSLASDDGSE